ncbi:MAG: ATP-binding protein, partial [bacterium]|nr:ATP-binding protein [bacterium]
VDRRELPPLPDDPEVREFLAARRAVFEAIAGQHLARAGEGEEENDPMRRSIVETADLLAPAAEIDACADAYRRLAERTAAEPALARGLAQIDTVQLRWKRTGSGDPRSALLAAPTHPLRLLWHLQHAAVCAQAIESWRGTRAGVVLGSGSWKAFTDELRREILPLNLPMALFDHRGVAYVEQGPLTPFWILYLPAETNGGRPVDVPACRERVRRGLGLKGQPPAPGAVGAGEIAARLFDYLQQHPYVEQLRLNVFNAAGGALLADTLRKVERRLRERDRNAPPVRYAVQLFAGGAHPETMGRALEALVDPERQVGEDDQFTLRSSNHLLPKLVFSRNTVEAFQRAPESFPAHVSIFVEQFRAGGHIGRVDDLRRGSFVCGLVHEPETTFVDHDTRFGWRKGIRVEVSRRPAAREEDLAALVSAVHGVQASAAVGAAAPGQAPIVELRLDGEGRRLLEQVHGYSDWVLTLDRHLGLEYYDRPAAAERAYLLDFAPEYLHEDRQRLMLTTRSTVELVGLLRPALEAHGLVVPEGAEPVVLEGLRSLSGRLALRLLAAPRRSPEIVGLLLARWLLEQTGKLEERVIIPVDAHQGWFGGAAGDGGPARRADLLLVGFDPDAAVMRVAVVEVKMRDTVHPGGELYAEMREQAEATARRLRARFDPELEAPRADAQLRAKELTTLVTFYLRRGERYGLIDPRAAVAALDFVQHLDAGFRLQVDTFGVVFDRQGQGAHVEEEEPGFPVFRFGLDAAQQLLDEVWTATASASAEPEEPPRARTRTSDPRFETFRSSVGGPATLTAPAPETRTPAAEESVGDEGYGPTVPEQHGISEHLDTGGEGEGYGPALVPPSEVADAPAASPAILAGANELTPQWGLLGRCSSQTVAVDLTGCNTISLFGVQGFGKSYTLGVIAEMAAASVPGINELPSPLATVIFHYHKSDAYPPEYASAVAPNQKQREIESLLSQYGAEPRGLEDVVLLTPAAKVADRREEFPGLEVRPIRFSSGELSAESWKFLLGAYGNDSLYVRQLVAIMRRYRQRLTVADLRREIAEADLPKASRRLAEDRLALAEPYIDDEVQLGELLRPGRTVIVDLRDEWIEKDEALGLFVVMLGIFAGSRHDGAEFNKLVVFDEAHKYIGDSELIGQVVEMIREMRHQATSVVIASQDPLSVPRSVIELTTILLLHRMTSPQWLKHLKGAISALDSLSGRQVAGLEPGEALLWAQRASDPTLTQRPRKIKIRPRFTQHGGGTRTAVSGVTIK